MAETNLQTRIKLKYDTLANWTKNDPVILAGEIAIATIPTAAPANKQLPPVMFKVGDGTSKFSALEWSSALAADVYSWAKASTRPAYKYGDTDLTGFGSAATKAETYFDKAGLAADAEKKAKAYTDEKIDALPAQAEYTLETGATDGSLVLKKDGVAVGDPAVVAGWAALLAKAQKGIDDAAAAQATASAKYTKPTGGIPKSDLAAAVQTSLGKADTALQSHQDISGKQNKAISLTGITAKTVEGALTEINTAAGSAKSAADKAQDDIGAYKTSNDAALAAVKKTADAAQTSSQVDAKITTHNASNTAHSDIRDIITALAEKVSGRATGYVYKNKSDTAYTTAIGKAGSFVVGDTIYFTDTNIPDQWVTAVNAALPFYTFQNIETEKTNLDGYVNALSGTANNGVITNLTKSGNSLAVTSENLAGTKTASTGKYISGVTQDKTGKITSITEGALPVDTNTWRPITLGGTAYKSGDITSGALNISSGDNVTISMDTTKGVVIAAKDTWQANTKDQAGYVAAGAGHGNSLWGTDNDNVPGWQSLSTLMIAEGYKDGDLYNNLISFTATGENFAVVGGDGTKIEEVNGAPISTFAINIDPAATDPNNPFAMTTNPLATKNTVVDAINALDYTDTPQTGYYVSQVNQTNGKIAVRRVKLPDAVQPNAGKLLDRAGNEIFNANQSDNTQIMIIDCGTSSTVL